MGKRRRFIDKKNSVTFHVVNRSQQDPLVADESAPQHVLVEAAPPNKDKQKEEQAKFGVYFDDDYNYLQHLRSRSEVVWERIEDSNAKGKEDTKSGKELKLPSSVFASTVEEEEGMLNKAAPIFGPQPDLDPDIIAALDDDFDYENPDNVLEDNFMEHALGDGDSDDEEDDDYEDYDEDDDENVSDIGELPGNFKHNRFDGEETKSRFTEYSISSSVMRRNEQLTLLDDRFEKFMENYDESEIGALECEDLEGGDFNYTNDMLVQLATSSKYDKYDTYDKTWDKQRLRKMQEESSEEELVEMVVEDDERPKVDCESVLSVATGRSYKPQLIESARRSKKIQIDNRGMPKDVLDTDRGLTMGKVNKLNSQNQKEDSSAMSVCAESVRSTLSILSLRPKDETKDEKKERKKLVKEYRAERRIERKANTQAFKEEKYRQDRIKMNTITKTLT
uniref:Protein LTV1 homolog n=1 Tax=Nyssomyia neivai TaxID=330878 RepID=A0A1L8DD15_9DIPT